MSVIVPVLNGAKTLPALLASLGSQLANPAGRVELLIIDNGSTDSSREIAARAEIPAKRVLDEPTRGASAARNRGLREARGDILALVDADCVPVRPWLRELVAPFIDPAVKLVAGGLASFPPRTGAQRFAARYGLNDARRNIEMRKVPFANTRNMAVRRGVAEAVGGWPVDVQSGEDVEFSYRVRAMFGSEIHYRESALVFHQDRDTDEELLAQARGYGRGAALIYARHPDVLRWEGAYTLRRMRRSALRRLSALTAPARRGLRLIDDETVEFDRYLAQWDRAFWAGFAEGRRAATVDGNAATSYGPGGR